MNENNNHLEPIVLGQLKKQKSSKPVFVVIVFLLLFGILFGLPAIGDYLKETDSVFSDIFESLFNNELDERIEITKDTIHTLGVNTSIPYDSILLTYVLLEGNNLTYTIKSNQDVVNLDEDTLYLEIFGAGETLLKRVKLTGNATNKASVIKYTFLDFKFNNGVVYYGRIHQLEDADYEKVTFAEKMGEINCTKNNHHYNYIFEDSALRIVKHTYTLKAAENVNDYINQLNYYNNLASKINTLEASEATSEETDIGLAFTAKLDLSKMTIKALDEYIDYNYYEYDKLAKIVKYEMIAKGFDCK